MKKGKLSRAGIQRRRDRGACRHPCGLGVVSNGSRSAAKDQYAPPDIGAQLFASNVSARRLLNVGATFSRHTSYPPGPLPNQLRWAPHCRGELRLPASDRNVIVKRHAAHIKRIASS